MEQGLSGKCVETLTAVPLKVSGEVPAWLKGELLRNGPGQFDVPLDGGGVHTMSHWFDGLTQLHAFHFDAGRVTYRSRHLYPAIERHLAKGGTSATFGPPSAPGGGGGGGRPSVRAVLFRKLLSALRLAPPETRPLDPVTGAKVVNVGVTVGHVGGKLVSKSDFNALVELDAVTLEASPPTTYTALNPAFKGYISAAHGQRDEARREYYNFTLDFVPGWGGLGGLYHIFAIPDGPTAGNADDGGGGQGGSGGGSSGGGGSGGAVAAVESAAGWLLASIKADPAYLHSFAMTENYLVLMVWPLLVSPLKLALLGSVVAAMRWQPQRGTMLYVVDRRQSGGGGGTGGGSGGHVATYRADAFYCFHQINGWEEGGALQLDLIGYDEGRAWVKEWQLPHLRSGKAVVPPSDIRRYTLPDIAAATAAGPAVVHAAQKTALAGGAAAGGGGAHFYELPRINKAVAMRPYQYTYAVAAASKDSPWMDALAKVDVRAGTTQLWQQAGHFPGEPVFVARPGGQREDDGVLLSVVLAGPQRHSYLLVLDAGSMAELARADVDHVIGFGFHGNFLAADGSSTEVS